MLATEGPGLTALLALSIGAIFKWPPKMKAVCMEGLLGAGRSLTKASEWPPMSVCTAASRAARQALGTAGRVVRWRPAAAATTELELRPEKAVLSTMRGRVPVDLKLASGLDYRTQVEAEWSVAEVRAHVHELTGVAPTQQAIVIAEDRARLPGISKLARKMHSSISTTRLDMRSAIISWVNFIFLPEVFNRELYGRGVISWAKGTTWYQSLLEAHARAAMAAAVSEEASAGVIKIQIEQLSGQVQVVEVEAGTSISSLKHAIERRLGVLTEQQRILILERRGPGTLTRLSNTMLLHSFAGLKVAFGAATRISSSLLFKSCSTFPVAVRTGAGRVVNLTITGETTVNQIRAMLGDGQAAPEDDVQEVHFPAHLPPLHAEVADSRVIKAVSM